MRYEVVINRESGTGLFGEMEPRNRLKRIFTDRGHEAEIIVVAPTDLEATLKKAADTPGHALLVGGGDGTVRTAASFLRGKDKALGVIPLGTFNLEARSLDIALDPFDAASQLIDADVTEIDLLSLNGHICLCAAVIGFYPALAKTRESFHGRSWWIKTIRIIHEIATVAVRAPALDLQITRDGETSRHRTRLAAFAPGRYRESFGFIPERDGLSSGQLSAYVSEHLTRWQMLGAAFKYLTGTLFDTEQMTRMKASEITINVWRGKVIPVMIDGETLSIDMPCHLKIIPRALRILRSSHSSD